MADLHPVKREAFRLADKVNVDPKGFERPVEHFRVQQGALYMAREADHPRFFYMESWLYPSLDMRVTWFHFRDHARREVPTQLMYIDIAFIDESDANAWTTRDIYIDIVTHSDGQLDVLDLDELGMALEANYLTAAEVARALTASQRILDGIQQHGSLEAWLESQGLPIAWKNPAPVEREDTQP